jgi:3-polyprenyl-4-hydroxybenzoate decarboxylase
MDPKVDVHVFSCTSQDTLDYTGPKVNEGSKLMMVATGEPRFPLHTTVPASLPTGAERANLFCDGCLVVQASKSYAHASTMGPDLIQHEAFNPYRLVVLVDDLEETLSSEMKFLWTLFTRFEPAADIHARRQTTERFHQVLEGPLLIDARSKPWYPGRLIMPDHIVKTVDEKMLRHFS